MKLARLLLLVGCMLVAQGCSEGARLELSIESEDPEVIRRTQAVLYYRLSQATRNPFANLVTGYFPDSNKLVFEYDRSAPDAASLRYLYETQGHYRVWSVDGAGEDVEWISNRDIDSVDYSRSGGAGQVFVALNLDSADRVQELSTNNIGTTVRSTLDGTPFQRFDVGAPFGRFFQFDLPSETEARNLAIILDSGALPVAVTAWEADETP